MELSIIQKSFALYKEIYTAVQKLPKEHKFLIGSKILSSSDEMQINILFAKHNPKHHKLPYILKALVWGDAVKSHLRLCLELKIINTTTAFKLNNQTTEIQRMLGGWKKSL